MKAELVNAALSPDIAEVEEALAEADFHGLDESDEALDARAWLVGLKHEYATMHALTEAVEALKGSRGVAAWLLDI